MKPTEQAGSPDDILDALDSLLTADGMFCVDWDQRIVQWSESAERVIGLKADDVVGRSCYEVIGGNRLFAYPYCQPDCPVLANARRRRTTRDFDVRIELGDEQRWLNVSIVLTEGSEEPLHAVLRKNAPPIAVALLLIILGQFPSCWPGIAAPRDWRSQRLQA